MDPGQAVVSIFEAYRRDPATFRAERPDEYDWLRRNLTSGNVRTAFEGTAAEQRTKCTAFLLGKKAGTTVIRRSSIEIDSIECSALSVVAPNGEIRHGAIGHVVGYGHIFIKCVSSGAEPGALPAHDAVFPSLLDLLEYLFAGPMTKLVLPEVVLPEK
jgi:hypothetical protein